MQRRLRIALAVTAAAGAALLGTGTAYADVVTDIIGGGTSQVSPTDQSGDYTADDSGDGDSSDADDSGDDSSSDDSGSDS
jgi:hypothetical protein